MIWLVRDFDLLNLLLRALSFALEALAFGALFFLGVVARPAGLDEERWGRLRRVGGGFALALAITQAVLVATTSAELVGSTGMGLRELASASFFIAGCVFGAAALAMWMALRWSARIWPSAVAAAVALGASVSLSHAASRMEDRAVLLALTAAHHLGMAAWVGGLLFLLLALRAGGDAELARATAQSMARRFSAMAVVAVVVLVGAGAGLSWFYAGSWRGMWGTSYGILLSAKIVLTALMVALGAANYLAIRGAAPSNDASGGETERSASAAKAASIAASIMRWLKLSPAWLADREGVVNAPHPLLTKDQWSLGRDFLLRLRRFGEVELGLAFTVLIAAASLTAQTPSVDEMPENTLTAMGVVQRLEWRWPSFHTPEFSQLAPATPLRVAVREATFTGGSISDAKDRAWSEYNHHWAGLIVLAAGILALVASLSRQRWAQYWPLLFLGLAVFIVVRADPECWPLGPRPFWGSFTAPDVLEHRVFALLIAAFAIFEWGVRTGRVQWRPAQFVFPALCAAGGALLLTHTHALGEGTDEVFAELSHTPMAVLGATAGWARWLELRLGDEEGRAGRVAAWVWPVCLVLVGLLLLNYRE